MKHDFYKNKSCIPTCSWLADMLPVSRHSAQCIVIRCSRSSQLSSRSLPRSRPRIPKLREHPIPFHAAAPDVQRLERCSAPVSAASNSGSTWAAGRFCNRGADARNSRARRLPSATLEIPNPDFRADHACASGTGNPSSAAASARSFRASCPWTRSGTCSRFCVLGKWCRPSRCHYRGIPGPARPAQSGISPTALVISSDDSHTVLPTCANTKPTIK